MSADVDGRQAVFDGEATSVRRMQFCIREILEENATFAPMSAVQLDAGTVFEVKCLFAIDAIAAVYSVDPARF